MTSRTEWWVETSVGLLPMRKRRRQALDEAAARQIRAAHPAHRQPRVLRYDIVETDVTDEPATP